MPEVSSPNTALYQIGKANVYFTPDGGGTRRHVGNVKSASFEMQTDKLDHFSAMAGIKKKDFTATLSATGTLNMEWEEISSKNLAIALLGDTPAPDTSTEGDGNIGFEIGAVASHTGRIEIIGSNDVGPKWTYDFYKVTLTPGGAVNFIGEDYTALALTGEVLAQDVGGGVTSFGKAILQGSA